MLQIWTIGHSTLAIEDFVAVLRMQEIEALADVRRFPGSRRYPHFARDALAGSLAQAGVAYVHFPELGGRRSARPDSVNTNWRNAGFRGYADYMETPEFEQAIERLVELGRSKRTAIMCAEALWWRCHRSLISDYFKAQGWTVTHILAGGKIQEHPFTSAAQLIDGRLSYAPAGLFHP